VCGLVLLTTATAATAGGSAPTSATTNRVGTSRAVISRPECNANNAAGPITYVSPFGFDASAGIIDVFAAAKLGYFADLCLKVSFVTNAFDNNELVSSGKAQITNEGSAADTLQAIAAGAHIVGIDTSGDTSDYALLTQQSITNLKQLEGKTLGYHSSVPVEIEEILHAAGVEISKVKLVSDNNYDPLQLIQGTVNGLQAYQSNEVLTLKAAHEPFHEWTPAQFRISGTYNVMVANATFLHQHRQAVADFMRADLRAVDFCLVHRARCVSIEGTYAAAAGSLFQVAHEKAVWGLESAFTKHHSLPGKGIGVQTAAEWTPEARALKSYGVVKQMPPLSTAEDMSLVASLYNGTKLIWP